MSRDFLPNGALTAECAADRQAGGLWLADQSLVNGIADCLMAAQCKHVVDLGAGIGVYNEPMRRKGYLYTGYDGIPGIAKLTKNVVKEADLSNKRFKAEPTGDAALCIEVGQFIPRKHAATFVRNVAASAKKLVVVTWAVPGQRGAGHANQLDPEDVTKMFAEVGMVPHPLLHKLVYRRIEDRRVRQRLGVFVHPANIDEAKVRQVATSIMKQKARHRR